MGFFPESNGTEDSQDSEMAPIEEVVSEPKTKKPRLLTGKELDQYDCKFGIRMDKDDVYILTDESEISSLNEEEVGELRKNYEEVRFQFSNNFIFRFALFAFRLLFHISCLSRFKFIIFSSLRLEFRRNNNLREMPKSGNLNLISVSRRTN